MALPKTHGGNNAIMVVVDWFSKMDYFIACHKCDDAIYIVDPFLQEIVRLHGILRVIDLDRYTKFVSYV